MTKTKMLFPMLLFAAASLAVSAQISPQGAAQPAKAEQQGDDCAQAGTQAEMNQCSAELYRKTDARLNALYVKLLHNFQEEIAQATKSKDLEGKSGGERGLLLLRQAERAWIQYRDLHCAAARHETEPGSMSPMVFSNCMTQLTEHRIRELTDAYELTGETFGSGSPGP